MVFSNQRNIVEINQKVIMLPAQHGIPKKPL